MAEFRWRHAVMPWRLNFLTAYSAVSSMLLTSCRMPSSPYCLSAYQSISGVKPFLEPEMVVSWTPTHSIALPTRSTYLSSGDDDAAGQRGSDELVPAYGDPVYAGVECEGLRVGHEWQDHSAERGVGVDVGLPDSQVLQYRPDARDVVDGAAHGRPDGCHDHHRQFPVDPNHVPQVLVVDFSVLLPPDHGVSDVEQADVFENAVVGLFGEVEHGLGQHLSCR